jgi:hypothetical protein
MKALSAFLLSLAAGIATFGIQQYYFPARLHAAPFTVPKGADWRQEMIEQYPGGPKVDHVLARLTVKLDLSPEQAAKFRPILESQRERILSLLLTAPASMTRDQFVLREQEIWTSSHKQLDALLTPDQLAIVKELKPHSNA